MVLTQTRNGGIPFPNDPSIMPSMMGGGAALMPGMGGGIGGNAQLAQMQMGQMQMGQMGQMQGMQMGQMQRMNGMQEAQMG
jgi:hypothetical protein